MEVYYFNIANFCFSIRFHNTEWIYLKEKLKNEVLSYLKNFEVKENPGKIHYQIDFIWEEKVIYLYLKKDTESYIRLYRRIRKNKIVCSYRLGVAQFQLLISNILSGLLTDNNGVLLHASAALVNKRADVFLGESGAGKSTVVTLLHHQFPALADDSVIIRKKGKRLCFYQTPFMEKGQRIDKSSRKYDLGKIYFLRKSNSFKMIKLIHKNHIMKQFARLSNMYYKKKLIAQQIKNIFELVNAFDNFYILDFNNEPHKLVKFMNKSH